MLRCKSLACFVHKCLFKDTHTHLDVHVTMWSEFAKERTWTGVVSLWNTLMDPSWRLLTALEKTDSTLWIYFRP